MGMEGVQLFIFLIQNIDCGAHGGSSNMYPQSMFCAKILMIIFFPNEIICKLIFSTAEKKITGYCMGKFS